MAALVIDGNQYDKRFHSFDLEKHKQQASDWSNNSLGSGDGGGSSDGTGKRDWGNILSKAGDFIGNLGGLFGGGQYQYDEPEPEPQSAGGNALYWVLGIGALAITGFVIYKVVK